MYNQYELVRSRTTEVVSGMLAYKEEVEVMSAALRLKIATAEQAASNFYYVRPLLFEVVLFSISMILFSLPFFSFLNPTFFSTASLISKPIQLIRHFFSVFPA